MNFQRYNQSTVEKEKITARLAVWPPPAFNVMAKPRGAICNLECAYCYYLKKASMYPKSDFRMSAEVLENFTRQYIQSQRVPQVTFVWQGGEPTLMGLDFFKQAMGFQRKYAGPGMRVENALQTNGTTLDDDWCAFFKENNFLIGISMDGPAHLHNFMRRDKGGAGTFEKVMAGLALLKKHHVAFNILASVHAANMDHPLDVYRFLRDEVGTEFIQFIPIVERANKKGEQRGNIITHRSVNGKQYGEFLIGIFDEWVRYDVGKVYVQIFDAALAKWMGQTGGLCIFAETCGTALVIEHNGDLFSCDHYVEPRYRLGNISRAGMADLFGSHKQHKFGLNKKDSLPRYCLNCEVLFACNGGCPKDRVKHTPDGEFGLNYLCEGYRAFFNHIDPAMRVMRDLIHQQQPPAKIMDLIAAPGSILQTDGLPVPAGESHSKNPSVD